MFILEKMTKHWVQFMKYILIIIFFYVITYRVSSYDLNEVLVVLLVLNEYMIR